MDAILAEPALYVYAGTADDGGSRHFEQFWLLFESLRQLVELNDVRLVTTSDIISAIEQLFPFNAINSLSRSTTPSHYYTAASVMVRFIANRTEIPRREYTAQESNIQIIEEIIPRAPVYSDGSLWLAWRDLLAQLACELYKGIALNKSLALANKEVSCVDSSNASFSILVASVNYLNIQGYRAAQNWPPGYIDPKVLNDIISRKTVCKPITPVYENSGHQPSRIIKKVLERTTSDANSILVRVNTTYYNPNMNVPCRLAPSDDANQVAFTISDGQETVRGYFTTTANNIAEQSQSLSYLGRFLMRRCEQAGIKYVGD